MFARRTNSGGPDRSADFSLHVIMFHNYIFFHYYLPMMYFELALSPVFQCYTQRATLKSWEEPGDEDTLSKHFTLF